MASPAERYATMRRRQQGGSIEDFAAGYAFALDPFQIRACQALAAGRGVLVAAPTGAGKTVVGEYAVHLALAGGRKCFYTTPIKALSNQKYADLAERHGAERVGLLTGDNSVNGDAPVVVMTTEVLRNMLYAGSPTLGGLGYVVMDEVHYLADRFRGAVWEEVIIHLPDSVQLVSLSATVSNAEEFGDWLGTVRGETLVVVEERRPVPLYQHVMVGPRLLDLFVDEGQSGEPSGDRTRVNPELLRAARDDDRAERFGDRRPQRGGHRPRRRGGAYTPRRTEVLERLDAAGLLPAITFVFSRAGCDAAVVQVLQSGVRLTDAEQRAEIRRTIAERTADLPEEDLAVLGYHDWAEGLERGVAAHHAGMLPAFKEVVEDLFSRGLVKAVFATETLALGINMPARCVVLERLVKWNGETHAEVTPGEYTQLTGRAGRRGIDVEGHAVVLWQPGLDPSALAGLASTRTYPLRSSFRPSYNMAVNLVRQVGRATARELLESSFAQFQADRAVVGLARQLRTAEEGLAGYAEAMTCEAGDAREYAGLRRAVREREATLARQGSVQRRAAVTDALGRLRQGDVVRVPGGRFAGLAVVLQAARSGGREEGPRPTVLTEGRQVRRLSVADAPAPVEALGRMRIPKAFNPKVPASRRDLAAALRRSAPAFEPDGDAKRVRRDRARAAHDAELVRLGRSLREHPVHHCPEREQHMRWAERHLRLEREADQLRRRVEHRTNTIARQFDRVCALLEQTGYLRGDEVTSEGRRLARLYTELDLVAAQCLREGLWEGLAPAELAACVSALTYESRQPDDVAPPRLPPGRVPTVLAQMVRGWADLEHLERAHGLDFLREPDLGFAHTAWRWASGHPLEAVLITAALTAGDFVRAMKQLLDLLDQVAEAAGPGSVRSTAQAAGAALRRGVVAYSSLTGA